MENKKKIPMVLIPTFDGEAGGVTTWEIEENYKEYMDKLMGLETKGPKKKKIKT